jgi:bacterial regulatory helix-turn-helix protein, lysR family
MNEKFSITSKHLKLLIALDQERSFVEAARSLGIADNYAHQMTKHLEKNLGVKITQPAQPGLGRNVKFTRQGEAIVRDAYFAHNHIVKLMSHGGDLDADEQ